MKLLAPLAAPLRALARRLDPAAVSASTTPNSADTPENAHLWRRLGGNRPTRDITQVQQKAAQDDSASGFQKFSLQRRATGIIRGFVCGAGGVKPKAEDDERAQKILDAFWKDPDNRIEDRVGEWSDNLSTFGELCLIAATGRDESGLGSHLTKLGLLDVGRVEDVLCDPEDAGRLIGVIVCEDVGLMNRRIHPVIRIDATLPREFDGKKKGDSFRWGAAGQERAARIADPCVWVRINALASQSRGLPDSYPALDALALRDRSQFSFMERLALAFAFIWDLVLPTSLKTKQVEDHAKSAAAAIGRGTGSVYAHTSTVSIEAKAPQSGAADYASALRIPMADILNAFALPEHWFSGGPEVSNASAGEIGSPTWTALQERQRVIRSALKTCGTYALAQIPEIGATKAAAVAWDVTLPVIVGKDAVREVTVLQQELGAIDQLRSMGLKIEPTQRESQRAANDYGMTISDDEWEDPEPVGLALPPRGPLGPSQEDQVANDGARVDPQGNPSDSKDQERRGVPGAGARAA